jgi:integrase
MGHTTTEMLFKVYSRYVPNLTCQDGSAFERLLASKLTNETPSAKSHPPINSNASAKGDPA